MFKRKNPLPIFRRVVRLLWPSGGLRRSALYVAHRIGRLPGTPYRIAAGFASGVAVSFTPFIGLHFVLAMVLSLLIRGNVIASAIGTVVGNPWTFPFIWAWIFTLGSWILGVGELEDPAVSFTLTEIFDRPATVFWPMLMGAVPTALGAWVLAYFPVSITVAQYQRTRRRRLRKRVRKLKLRAKEEAPPVVRIRQPSSD